MFKNRKKIFRFANRVHEQDNILLITIVILATFGLAMLASASAVYAYKRFGNSYYYFNRQLFNLTLGFFVFFIFSKINYHVWRKYAFMFFVGSCVLLGLVFFPKFAAGYGSASSWIKIFGFSLQPSEFVKVSFLIYLAAWVDNKKNVIGSFFEGAFLFIIIIFIISVLMIMQPDFGTLIIIAFSAFVVFFIGGGRISHILAMVLLPLMFLTFILNTNSISRLDYVRDRFECVTTRDFEDKGTCFQVNQSLIAVGSGGLFGKGIGQSEQKHHLPQVDADSIFPIIAEEVGFIFSSFLLLLYFTIFYRGILIAKSAPDNFGVYLSVGIVSWIAAQMFLNIGGMIGIIPMTGVPLPLVSHGGSAVLATFLALGILVNISKYA